MRRRSDTSTGELELFSNIPQPVPELPETMDFRQQVNELLTEAICEAKKLHGLDRYELAARISRLTGQDTSKAVLDQYTSSSREEYNAPFWKVPAIELACKSRSLANWHVQILGGRVYWGQEVMDAEIGLMQREHDEMTRRLRELKNLRKRLG